MTCGEVRGAIDAYLDDELGVLEALRVQSHVRRCDACRNVLDAEATLHALLAADALQDDVPERLRERIVRQSAVLGGKTSSPRRWRVTLFGAYLSGAATVALLLALLFIPASRSPAEGRLAMDAVVWHRHRTASPTADLDLRTADPERLAAWLHSRLGLVVAFPPAGVRGERLVGARLAQLADRRAAQVLYEGGGRRVSLFATRRPFHMAAEGVEHSMEGLELYMATLEGVSVAWWNDGGHLYVAAVETGEADLMALAALCVRLDRERAVESRPRPVEPRKEPTS